jgi:hypothetical protein
MSNVFINIASEFTGAAAFKKAGKASAGLEKSVKKLAGALGIALSATAVVNFGKAAVKAFMDDEKAANALANTLKNLGVEFAVASNETFLQSLEDTTAVAKGQLRPALASLITQTGSLTYAQDLLSKAIEISRGSGVDLETVTSDLGNAYLGNTKGLSKYETGLTKAQIAGMSFEQIMEKLNGQFAGSNAAFLETYAGKMEALTRAGEGAKDTIGKGLVDAINILAGGGDSSITSVTESIAKLAEVMGNYFRGVATYVRNIYDNPIMQKIIKAAMWLISRSSTGIILKRIAGVGKETKEDEETTPTLTAAQKALLAEQKKRAIEQAKLIRAQKIASDKAKKQAADEAKLKKANGIFDIEQIQLVAALKGNLSDQDRKRIELQMAVLTGNTSEATKLAGEIAKSQGLTEAFVKFYSGIPNAKDPFVGWIETLKEAARLAAAVAAGNYNVRTPTYNGAEIAAITSTYGTGATSAGVGRNGDVNVYVAGNVVSEGDLVELVRNGLLEGSLSGSASSIGRLKGSFQP